MAESAPTSTAIPASTGAPRSLSRRGLVGALGAAGTLTGAAALAGCTGTHGIKIPARDGSSVFGVVHEFREALRLKNTETMKALVLPNSGWSPDLPELEQFFTKLNVAINNGGILSLDAGAKDIGPYAFFDGETLTHLLSLVAVGKDGTWYVDWNQSMDATKKPAPIVTNLTALAKK